MRESKPSPTVTEWPSVQKRLAALEQHELAHGQELDGLRDANLPQQFAELSGRVVALQATAEAAVSKEDHVALTDRVSALEARLARTRAAVSQATMPEVRVIAQKESTPPFVVLGIEWRGGERFVAVSSAETEGLAAVHLLRVGDHESDWELQALEGDTAVFARAGHIERIHVP